MADPYSLIALLQHCKSEVKRNATKAKSEQAHDMQFLADKSEARSKRWNAWAEALEKVLKGSSE
jgi:heme oxygenase